MQLYETIYIVKQDLDDKSIKSLEEKYESLLKLNKATIEYKENWGLRNLAYKINNNKKGHYFLINIDCNPSAIFEYERQMRINEDIIRFLTIKIDHISDKPSILNINSQDFVEPSMISKKVEDNLEKKET